MLAPFSRCREHRAMESNILKRIFFDEHNHWDHFVKKYHRNLRPNVIKEVEKFKGCRNPKNGFKLLVCEGCHDIKRVPYRCKVRFCTTSSCGETEERGRLLLEEVFKLTIEMIFLRLMKV
jgi:hypothetical protein